MAIDNTWIEIIKENVYKYVSSLDYTNPDFDINKVKDELAKIIGVRPAVKIRWVNKLESINELKREAGLPASEYEVRKEVPSVIDIIFVDENNVPIKLQYLG
jgi:hypothetical protein